MFKFVTVLSAIAASASAATVTVYGTADCSGTALATIPLSTKCGSASASGTSTSGCETEACSAASDSKTYSVEKDASCSTTTVSGGTPTVAWDVTVRASTDCTGTSFTFSGSAAVVSTTCYKPLVAGAVKGAKIDLVCTGCFPTEATVQHKDGRVTAIADVNVGDEVLSVDASGNTFFDKVFRITEHDTLAKAQAVTLKTASSALTLTPNHFVHVNGVGAEHLQAAGDVKVGDMLHIVKAGMVIEEPVVSIEPGMQSGLINVHTLHSNIVVNSVVASHFTTETTWTEKSRGFAPMWYNLLDALPFAAENAKAH